MEMSGPNVSKEVTDKQGHHAVRGGDAWTSRQRKQHPQSQMRSITGLLEGAREAVVSRVGHLSPWDSLERQVVSIPVLDTRRKMNVVGD